MKFNNKEALATAGLFFITLIGAIQYVFLQNVPDTVSTFAFVCITNLIGFVLLGGIQLHKIMETPKKTYLKGIIFAVELTGFNFFTIIGSRNLDPVIIASVVSLYFVFITPIMVLFRRKINFFSGVASVIAIAALLLMFGADTDMFFASKEIIYLLIADVFFAAYVVSVAQMGSDEDTVQLSFAQMLFAALFGLIGWVIESALGHGELTLPTSVDFWISAIFIGIFIRVVYGLVQIASQKHVSALKASLIFASEILITLITNPIMCAIFGRESAPVSVFQVVGAILFIVAMLMIDDGVMSRLGYDELEGYTIVGVDGKEVRRDSVSKKIIIISISFSLITLVLSTVISLSSISFVRSTSVSGSKVLGEEATSISSNAMTTQVEKSLVNQAGDKTILAEEKLGDYGDAAIYAGDQATYLYKNRGKMPAKEVDRPHKENQGKWVLQRTMCSKDIPYSSLKEESKLLGNMEDIFASIIKTNDNIAALYMATESGFMVSYDPNSELADTGEEVYFDYKKRDWYKNAKKTGEVQFTEAYQDGFGRGLTVTCVAPFYDENGDFYGCVGMDILVGDLNASMVNDGIEEPSSAILIDVNGKLIAGRNVDPKAEETGTIFDDKSAPIAKAGKEILANRDGVLCSGEEADAQYIAFSTIQSTDWILCIMTPVSEVMKPVDDIRDRIDTNTNNVVSSVVKVILNTVQTSLIFSALILLLVTLFTGQISKSITGPLKTLEKDVRKISDGNLDQRTSVDTNDEIGSLAVSFNHMTDSLQKYIEDLKDATAREERIASELNVATRIQADMLPRIFPAFPERPDIDLYAVMDPAKEVGGDFYDFFMVDADHLALVMADVSGKGVPAALFMVIAKTLLKNHLQSGESVDQVLTVVNDQLSENNEEMLFVTTWIGIVNLKTGEVRYSDAGHETTLILHPDGSVEEIHPSKKKIPLACMEGMKYIEDSFTVANGDLIFLYTDGVPEATSASEELYGMERLKQKLGESVELSPEELLKAVRADVDEFVGEAPQFDDLTMLGYKVNI